MDSENAKHLIETYKIDNETAVSPYSLRILESWLQGNRNQVAIWQRNGELNSKLLELSEAMTAQVARLINSGMSKSESEFEAGQMGIMPPAR